MTASDLTMIKTLVGDELSALDSFINNHLGSSLAPINELNRYIIDSGGKRLRPLSTLLTAHALNGYSKTHLSLAAIIEFIHTATLLHDDVVDDAELRRGKKTIKHLWGNNLSILVGDFLYSRAFQLIAEIGDVRITEVLAGTTNTISEGEVQQLLNCRHTDITESTYLEVIYRKTAVLFEAATQTSAFAATNDKVLIQAFTDFGRHVGFAFQLLDDALDYDGLPTTGKELGGDLAEGKVTAPFIHALKHCSAAEAQILRQAISDSQSNLFEDVCIIIKKNGGLKHTYQQAEKYAGQACAALTPLPNSTHKQALENLATFAVVRDY